MFYYYGRKKQIARHYPAPNFDTIVEPFAGAAAYSLHGENWRKRVLLFEKDEKVSSIWNWLIHDATVEELLKLPDLKPEDHSNEFLHIVHAVTKMAFNFKRIKVTPVLARNWEISKRIFVANLHKVKHWEITCGDYTEAPDIEATWFIDPPYKGESGMGYRHSSAKLDYKHLSAWAKKRKGEVIFCEGADADYLPFKPLIDLKGVAGKVSKEYIYYKTPKRSSQLSLFNEDTQQR